MYSKIYATWNWHSYSNTGVRLLGLSGFETEFWNSTFSPFPLFLLAENGSSGCSKIILSLYDGLLHGINLGETWMFGLHRAADSASCLHCQRWCPEEHWKTPPCKCRGLINVLWKFFAFITFPYLMSLKVWTLPVSVKSVKLFYKASY